MRVGVRLFTLTAFLVAPFTVAAQGFDENVVAFVLPEPTFSTLQLSKVVLLRNTLNQTRDTLLQLEQHTNEITKDQSRIHDNMRRLSQNSSPFALYIKRLDNKRVRLNASMKT